MTGWAQGSGIFVNPDGSINTVIVSGGSTSYQAPFISNITAVLSGIEYLHTFPSTTKRYLIRTRKSSAFKIAFVSGDTLTGNHVNIRAGCYYTEQVVNTNLPLNIYIQTTKVNEIIEILYWA